MVSNTKDVAEAVAYSTRHTLYVILCTVHLVLHTGCGGGGRVLHAVGDPGDAEYDEQRSVGHQAAAAARRRRAEDRGQRPALQCLFPG